MKTTGLFCSTKGKKSAVPLKRSTYEIKIAGICGEITVLQKFINTGNTSIEAVYLFPKEEGAVITGFSFETEGRRFSTKVEEKDTAFGHYDEAIRNGDGATLLDEVSRDVVQISVGNLKPGQEISFTIQWAQELKVSDGKYRLLFPLTRFPRYQRIDADPVSADIQNSGFTPSLPPYSMNLSVTWENTFIKNLSSPSHHKWGTPKAAGPDKSFTEMTMIEGMAAFNRDLELVGEPAEKAGNLAFAARHSNGSMVLYSCFTPQTETWPAPRQKDVVFLLDCSGSMEGAPIENAKRALDLCIRSLSDGDTFSFVVFGSDFRIIRDKNEKPFCYTDENFNKAIEQINAFSANMGGTELYHAVAEILQTSNKAENRQEWVLLTDGAVSDPESVIQLVAGSKTKPRIFTFGIGHGASTSLLKGLARVTGGSCEMILDDNTIGESVLRQFSRIDQPRFENIRIDLQNTEYEIAEPAQSIFEGDSWHTIMRLKDPNRIPGWISLAASVEGSDLSCKAPVKLIGDWNTPGCLWAAKKVRFLEDFLPVQGSNQAGRSARAQRSEALGIALEFGILCSQTSMVGIETRQEGDKWIEKPEYVIVPVLPAEDRMMPLGGPMGSAAAPMAGLAFSRKQANTCSESEDTPMFSRKLASTGRLPENQKTKQPWYLELIAAMRRDGLFAFEDTRSLLSEKYSSIKDLITALRKQPTLAANNNAIATLLAIKAIEADTNAYNVCKKSIKKARSALEKAGIDLAILDTIVIR